MTYSSATFLASLLVSAHGFAAIPGEVECSANEQKFFVYSFDLSLIYPFVASVGGPDFTDNETVTRGLVGNTWQGVQLSITQGDTTITQARGKPLTVTSPNTLESGGFNVVSEDFCLGYGTWTVKATAPTHPEMASYNRTNVSSGHNLNYNLAQRLAPGAPVYAVTVKPQELVDWIKGPPFNRDVNNYNNNTACNNDPTESLDCAFYAPFFVGWGIFPAEMRAAAEAAASTGPLGTSFIADNSGKDLDPRQVVPSYDYQKNVVVPIREDSDLRRRLSVGGSSSTRG